MSYKVNEIQKDDVKVVNNIDTLNFEGNVTVVDDTGGKATVTIGSSSGLSTVTTFVGLPGSPTTNDIVFYTPFNSVLTFDGTDWVGPKISGTFFGREGTGNNDVWLKSIGRAEAFPSGGIGHGLCVPNITVGSGTSKWKFYNIAISTVNLVSGDMEIHADSISNSPVFATTGIAKATLTSQRSTAVDITPATVDGAAALQCYWRRISGQWRDWTVVLTYSYMASA